MAKTPDRRTVRTKEFLRQALMELIAERGYERLSVQDIIDRANIGRSTFYTHFHDKEDLLVSGFNNLGASTLLEFAPDEKRPTFITMVPLLEHGAGQYHLFKMMTGGSGMDAIMRKLQKQLARNLDETIHSLIGDGSRPDVPVNVMAHLLASSFLSLMKWWLENGMPHSPAETDAMFQKMIMPGFWQQLGR